MEGEDLTLRDDLVVGDDLTVGWNATITGTLSVNWGEVTTGWVVLAAWEDLVGSSTSDIKINTDKFTVAWATGNTAVGGTFTATGLITATAGTVGKVIHTGSETIAAAGTTTALDLTKFHHDIDADAGGDIFTLANGTAGQLTLIVLKTATGVATITPETFLGGTSVTLNAVWDSVMLYYGTLGRQIAGGNGYTIVA